MAVDPNEILTPTPPAVDPAALDAMTGTGDGAPAPGAPEGNTAPPELIDAALEAQPLGPTPEPVQVAGGGLEFFKSMSKKAGEAIDRRAAEADKRLGHGLQEEPIKKQGDYFVVRDPTPQELTDLAKAAGIDNGKGLNWTRMVDENGQLLDASAFILKLKEANADLFENARRGTLNITDMLAKVEAAGLDHYAYKMLQYKPGVSSIPMPEDVLGGYLSTIQIHAQLNQLAKKMADGTATAEEIAIHEHGSAVLGTIAANTSAGASEGGRLLYVASQLPELKNLKDIAAGTLKMLEDPNARELVSLRGRMFLALKDMRQQVKFAVKSVAAKTADALVEAYINSLLSSPVTHFVNVSSNAAFLGMNLIERQLAGVIGAVRTRIPGSNPDRVAMSEAWAMTYGMVEGFNDALVVAGRAFIKEEPTNLASKIDVRNRKAISADSFGMRPDTIYGRAVDVVGQVYRLPSRLLTTEDEFFKAIARRSEIRAQATAEAEAYRISLVDSGMDEASAATQAKIKLHSLIENPPESLVKKAQDFSETVTYQKDLEGALARVGSMAAHPAAKLIVPFFKTPTNIVLEGMSRTPVALATPRFWKAIKAGGREADLALSRFALGSAMMGSAVWMTSGLSEVVGEDVVIVGSGPDNKGARDAMARMRIQPSSINIRQEDGTYKSIPFSRYDPLGMMLTMAADYAYYMKHEYTGEGAGQAAYELSMISALAMYDYADNLPLAQGFAELTAILGDARMERKARFERTAEVLSRQLSTAALSVVNPMSSGQAFVKRMIDPQKRVGYIADDDAATANPVFRGFQEALARAKARSPFFSNDLPPALNRWGQPIMEGDENTNWFGDQFLRIKGAEWNRVDAEILDVGGAVMPRRTIDGVKLTDWEYHDLVNMAGNMDHVGRMPGHPGFDSSKTMLSTLKDLINDPAYSGLGLDAKRQKINAVISAFDSAARDMLKARSSDLRSRLLK